jgi:hypothetical protein
MNILQLVGYRESSVKKTDITAVGICSADHATPLYPLKLALTLPTRGGHSVGIVRSRTKATELVTGNHCTSTLLLVTFERLSGCGENSSLCHRTLLW